MQQFSNPCRPKSLVPKIQNLNFCVLAEHYCSLHGNKYNYMYTRILYTIIIIPSCIENQRQITLLHASEYPHFQTATLCKITMCAMSSHKNNINSQSTLYMQIHKYQEHEHREHQQTLHKGENTTELTHATPHLYVHAHTKGTMRTLRYDSLSSLQMFVNGTWNTVNIVLGFFFFWRIRYMLEVYLQSKIKCRVKS